MDELDKGLDICLRGAEAEKHLARCKKQLAEWNVVMPDVPPLVLDFGLGNFADTGLIEYWIANETEAGYCGKYLFVFDRQTCPTHRHKTKIETFFVANGRVRMEYGNGTLEMKRGDTLRVERWNYHSFTGIGPALLLELSMPCLIGDNYFQNPAIPIGRKDAEG